MRTLYGQMMVITTVVLGGTLVLFLMAVFLLNSLHARMDTRHGMLLALTAITDALRDNGVGARSTSIADRIAAHLGGGVNIYGPHGRAVAGAVAPPAWLARDLRTAMAEPSPVSTWWRTQTAAGAERLWVVEPVYLTSPGRFVFVLLEAPVRPLLPSLRDASAVAVAVALSFLLAQALWSVALRRFTRAMRALTRWAERLAHGDLRATVEVTGTAELAHLADVLQGMAAAVSAERDRRLAFLGEVAHDLRTPLAVQRTVLDVIAAGGEERAEVERLAQQAKAETERMIRLVNDLLDLARLESDPRAVERRPVDLREPAAMAAAGFQVLADRRGIALHVDLAGRPVRALGDADRVAQVVGNLLDNAVRETPAGGEVAVRVYDGGQEGGAVIEVADSGPGLPADVTAALGRMPARLGERPSGRHGLGLAIACALVRAMGGDLRVLPGPGARLRVSLPRAAGG